VGFEVELAEALAKRLNLRARHVQGQWEGLLEHLARGDFDVALNGIEVTQEKGRVCLLSRPYYVGPQRLTVRKGDAAAPRSLAAMRGRRIGTIPNSAAERILRQAGADVRTYEGGQGEIYDDLRVGRTDAVLLDDPVTLYYGAIEPALEVLAEPFGEVRYAIAVRLGEGDLLAAIDAALGQLLASGELQRIYERYGLWNADTARLLGVPLAPGNGEAPELERWREAVGKLPPFWERIRTRYPATLPLFARGALLTLSISILSMLLAVLLGIPIALGRVQGSRGIRWLCTGYVEFIRGTPLLVQLLMIYFGLPELGVKLDPFLSGWIALGLNYAAAEAENIRAGLESLPRGQAEAAHVLGLSRRQALRLVLGPQALRVSTPAMTNDFIALLKDSSLVSLVTLTELTKTYLSLANAMRDHLGLGLMVALWYLLIGLPFSRLSRRLERRLGRHLAEARR
jgi:polar amino acid transport system substrate-binding protein